jgi:hypothetical protein
MSNEEFELMELLEQRNLLNEEIDTLEFEVFQGGRKALIDQREMPKPFKRLQQVLEPAGFSIVNLWKLDPKGISWGHYLLHVAHARLYRKSIAPQGDHRVS